MSPCPLQPCGAWVGLAKLDTTKATSQNFLDLIHKRHHLKYNLNLWHDRLVCRLPVEIVSRIFIFLDKINEPVGLEARGFSQIKCYRWDHILRTPVLLSRECRRWRNIVLSTPQLWTNIMFNIWTQSHKLDLLKLFLSRSGSLPLGLVLCGGYVVEDSELENTSLEPIAEVIRSHSARWKTLDIDYAPRAMAHKLLHNLNHTPTSDLFDLRIGYLDPEPITLRKPLRPRRFCITEVGDAVTKIPLEWDNITHLELSNVQMSTLLSIVHRMPRLTIWISEGATPFPEDFEASNKRFHPSPIVIPTLEHLEISFKDNDTVFFRYLTLPALTHLQCHFGDDFPEDTRDAVFEGLINFIARSQLDSKSLRTFDLKFDIVGANYDPTGLKELTAVTHLNIDILDTTNGVLDPYLLGMSDSIILPHLRELRIQTPYMFPSAWRLLCDILRDHCPVSNGTTSPSEFVIKKSHDYGNFSNSQAYIQQRFHKRPLELVSVNVYAEGYKTAIPYAQYLILRDIQKGGEIKLELQDIHGANILVKMSKICRG